MRKMDPELPMILPKGIVVNTKEIYDEVAKHSTVPMDRVWQIWRVYTTTNKKLQDPTARRLENFWWHVLGSDRRKLNGEVLATLYEDISLGPTFISLRGPPNRWEGNDATPLIRQALSTLAPDTASGESHDDAAHSEASKGSSSASRPPPPHPILKKPSGPSSSGTRPTARFASPPSDGEDLDYRNTSSGSTVTPSLEMRPAIMSPPKKKPSAGKKFVASTASAKRRPVLTRRTSSQTSVVQDQASKDGGSSSAGSRFSGTPQRPVSPLIEGLQRETPAESVTESPKTPKSPKLSDKAAGKRPALPRRNTRDRKGDDGHRKLEQIRRQDSMPNYHRVSPPTSGVTPGSVSRGRSGLAANRAQSLVNLPDHTRARNANASSESSTVDQNGIFQADTDVAVVPMAPSRSHSGFIHRRESSISGLSNPGLFTGATASTTNVAAQGMIIDQSGSVRQGPDPGLFDQRMMDSVPAASSFSSSFTPTRPTTSASVPLGRTKSQLTLLLEREKDARSGSKSNSKY